MAKGRSLHIGLNDPSQCRTGDILTGPEHDAADMADIAREQQFEVGPLLVGDEARWDRACCEIQHAVEALEDGDIFFLSFAGHGRQARDRRIQTWCLADRELKDSELIKALGHFSPGVRVLVVSASCHSGGIHFGPLEKLVQKMLQKLNNLMVRVAGVLGANEECVLEDHGVPVDSENPPSMLFLTSCREEEDSQDAKDGKRNSLFTEKLLQCWDCGRFKGNYRDLINQVSREVNGVNFHQTPTCAFAGTFPKWHSQPPFTINPPAAENLQTDGAAGTPAVSNRKKP